MTHRWTIYVCTICGKATDDTRDACRCPMSSADGVEVIPAKPVTTLVDRLDPEGRTMIRDGEDYAADRRAEMNRQTFGTGIDGGTAHGE